MDVVLFFILCLCWWVAAARSLWSDKPDMISPDEILDGESVKISCTLPIDYGGGDCRLYRRNSHKPFKVVTAVDYICDFHLTSQELLGKHPVGSRVYLKCDYHLQQYTSPRSDLRGVTVWGSSPSPVLSVSRHFVSPDDSVEVTCTPPLKTVDRCTFYRDEYYVAEGSCSQNLTGRMLAIWEKPALLVPVNLTCKYHASYHLQFRSEPSNHNLLFVVDESQVVSSVDCKVSVDDNQLAAFRNESWTSGSPEGLTVKVHATNSRLMINETCNHIESELMTTNPES